ncbi:MAG TPA: pseudouridine synthase [Gammaproteobacteria bacterium]
MRLNKYISSTGMCSRREADAWIERGRVTVNGRRADLGTQVSATDQVRVNGRPITVRRKNHIYIALNKPSGITCTTDRHVAGNIIDFIKHEARIFPIGRLDKESEGLILLTSDGDVVNEILRAEHKHEKEYIVTVDRPITDAVLAGMSRGVRLPELNVTTRRCRTSRISARTFRIILTQGLNRQIRRMCEVFGYRVNRLQRIRIINIRLDGLKSGRWRNLKPSELRGLLPSAHAPSGAARRKLPDDQH